MRSSLLAAAFALLLSAIVGCGGGSANGGGNAGENRANGGGAGSAHASGQTPDAVATPAAGPVGSAASAMPRRVLIAGRQPLSDGDADNPEDLDGNPDPIEEGHDGDKDVRTRASYIFPDSDDVEAFNYGHAADATQRASITQVVERYDRAAREGDGAAACSLLLPSVARAVPATYGQGVGSSEPHPRQTCAGVASALLRKYRRMLQPSMTVVAARVQGIRAEAILGSFSGPASNIFLDRQGSAWRVEQVLLTVLL